MQPDPHSWTQSRAAVKLYELEQRINDIGQKPQVQEGEEPPKTPRKRTPGQKKNDKIMKKQHVHLATLKARTNKFGKKGAINKSSRSAAFKEARRRAKRELGMK